nr:PREDICTED: S100P-binding protein isoform X1 [Lepisosteus oculatus]
MESDSPRSPLSYRRVVLYDLPDDRCQNSASGLSDSYCNLKIVIANHQCAAHPKRRLDSFPERACSSPLNKPLILNSGFNSLRSSDKASHPPDLARVLDSSSQDNEASEAASEILPREERALCGKTVAERCSQTPRISVPFGEQDLDKGASVPGGAFTACPSKITMTQTSSSAGKPAAREQADELMSVSPVDRDDDGIEEFIVSCQQFYESNCSGAGGADWSSCDDQDWRCGMENGTSSDEGYFTSSFREEQSSAEGRGTSPKELVQPVNTSTPSVKGAVADGGLLQTGQVALSGTVIHSEPRPWEVLGLQAFASSLAGNSGPESLQRDILFQDSSERASTFGPGICETHHSLESKGFSDAASTASEHKQFAQKPLACVKEKETSANGSLNATQLLHRQVRSVIIAPATMNHVPPAQGPVNGALSGPVYRNVVFEESELEQQKKMYVQRVSSHMADSNAENQGVMNELLVLMSAVAGQGNSTSSGSWQHPSDLTKRNYRRALGKPVCQISLQDWQKRNGKYFRRFASIPDKFNRSRIADT